MQAGAVDELVELLFRPAAGAERRRGAGGGRPGRLDGVVEDLRRERGRLTALSAGDLATDVRAVFSGSLRELDDPGARMFRLLGLHPGRDISVPAAASVAGCPPGDARRALEDLTEAYLLTPSSPGRYAMHDLL